SAVATGEFLSSDLSRQLSTSKNPAIPRHVLESLLHAISDDLARRLVFHMAQHFICNKASFLNLLPRLGAKRPLSPFARRLVGHFGLPSRMRGLCLASIYKGKGPRFRGGAPEISSELCNCQRADQTWSPQR